MSDSIENSQIAGALVIEVIGPLLDDGGAISRTYQDLLASEQVVLRPGAVGQVAGAAIEWTLQTLLEGHGRFDLTGEIPTLARRITREMGGLPRAGSIRPARGAEAAWQQVLSAGGPVLLLFGGEPTLVPELFLSAGLPLPTNIEIAGGGSNGLPRPDAVKSWLGAAGLAASEARGAVRTPAAALAAAGAGLRSVSLVGDPLAEHAMLPVDATAPDLDAFLRRSTIQDR